MPFLDSSNKKILLLGTALWGWGISKGEAYKILEKYLDSGGKIIDTATNYPINKNPDDFGVAIKWLTEWIAHNNIDDIHILVKIGSINNNGESTNNLSRKFIFDTLNELSDKLHNFLSIISIHWDNRESETEISETLSAMLEIENQGYSVGLSGIQRPDIYAVHAPSLSDKWWIQVKENLKTNESRNKYQNFFPNSKYIAYGINMGGVKQNYHKITSSLFLRNLSHDKEFLEKITEFLLTDNILHPTPKNIHDLFLMHAFVNRCLRGVIIGPRNIEQLVGIMDFWNMLQKIPENNMDNYLSVISNYLL